MLSMQVTIICVIPADTSRLGGETFTIVSTTLNPLVYSGELRPGSVFPARAPDFADTS